MVNIPKVNKIEEGSFVDSSKLTNISLNGNVIINNSTSSHKVFNDATTVNINRIRDDATKTDIGKTGKIKVKLTT